MDDVSNKRIGNNESLFRETNEGIERGLWPGEGDQPVPFRCECAWADCAEVVRLTPGEYERVGANPRRFVIVAGHEAPGAELLMYPDGSHGLTNHAFESRAAMADWLAARL